MTKQWLTPWQKVLSKKSLSSDETDLGEILRG